MKELKPLLLLLLAAAVQACDASWSNLPRCHQGQCQSCTLANGQEGTTYCADGFWSAPCVASSDAGACIDASAPVRD